MDTDVVRLLFGFLLHSYIGESSALSGANICQSDGIDVCCYNFHAVGDKCEACPLGTYGQGCISTCSEGFYGLFCKDVCNCDSSKCDKQTGCASSSTKLTTIEADGTLFSTEISRLQTRSQELTTERRVGESFMITFRQSQSTFHIEEKNNKQILRKYETNGLITLTEIVAVASSTTVVILLVLIFVFLLHKKLRKIKKRDEDRKPDGRLTSVVMSKIYDEINDNCSERSASEKSKFESKSPDDSGESCVEMGGSNVFKKQRLSKQSRASYLPLLEPTKQDATADYDMLDRASTSRCLSKVVDCNEEYGEIRVEKSGKRDKRKDRRESTNIYSVPPRKASVIHLQDEKIGGDKEMPIYKIPRSILLRMSEIPPLPLKK